VALVISSDGTTATLYLGAHSLGLQSSVDDVTSSGDLITSTNTATPLVLARSIYSYWEDAHNAYGGNVSAYSDVTVYYNALSASAITNLYVTGAGLIAGMADPNTPGNMLITYPIGVLQSAPAVGGPYTDVVGANTPYSTPMSGSQKFFRVRD